jgi:ubiquinone/menaquinone biosynthesis C-methylase UbiE/uncharacterized protein YbaR (Trm112 family)
MAQNIPDSLKVYVCPKCKGQLTLRDAALGCPACQVTYPIVGGIPDFIAEDLAQSTHSVLRGVKLIDWLAPIYESRLWYPLVLNLYGGWHSITLEQLAHLISNMVGGMDGLILDVACGPGTYGRRVAAKTNQVYGIDISLGMLRQGIAYTKRDHLDNVHFARAQVEDLPFRDALFDAAICCGSLHLFADTVRALREIGRAMKGGAPLAVMTFIGGDKGILRFTRVREHVRKDHGVHVFEIPELEGYLTEAGFEDFRPQTYGSVLVFSARKQSNSSLTCGSPAAG